MNSLETLARNFVISAKAGRLLERHRSTVLMLRAKDATLSQIQDLLAQHGVIVSESSITRFCRNIAPRLSACGSSLNRISIRRQARNLFPRRRGPRHRRSKAGSSVISGAKFELEKVREAARFRRRTI